METWGPSSLGIAHMPERAAARTAPTYKDDIDVGEGLAPSRRHHYNR